MGVNCAATLASDGKMRCLPQNGTYTYFYSDAACTNSLLTAPPPNPTGWPAQTTYLSLAYNSSSDGGAWSDVHQPSAFSGTAYTYGQLTDGGAYGCIAASPQPSGLFDLGPVVLPAGFMEFVPTTL